MSRGLAAVTGATGFLGRHLVRALADDGWRLRILARRDVIHPLWRELAPEVVVGDLDHGPALDRLCHGADLVVHAAGLTKARDAAAFDAVNVAGVEQIATRTDGRMILVSSLAARDPGLSDYAASKRRGESAASRILGDRVTIVRPPALYGPGDPETLPLFQAAACSPVLPVLDPSARIALMHVRDTAEQIAALARLPPGLRVTLSDARAEGYAWDEIMRTAAAGFGRKPRLLRIPDGFLTVLALASLATKGRGEAPMLSLGKLREMRHPDWSVSPAEQPIALPASTFDLVSGFRDAIYGYESDGVVFGKVKRLEKERTDILG